MIFHEQPIAFQSLALGRHLTVEYYDCDARVLADVAGMQEIFIAAAHASGATVLESSFHAFKPQGVSGIVVISESHFAVHAWPEHDYAAVDIFTCGDRIDFKLAVERLRSELGSKSVVISHALSRGIIGQNGAVLQEKGSGEIPEGVLSWRKRYESVDAWGMLASIDVYECPREVFNPGSVRALLTDLVEKLHAEPCGESQCVAFHQEGKGDGLRFSQILDTGTVTGRLSQKRRTFYCDIFLNRFFDPREIAESLIEVLSGGYYRLQVALRQ